MARQRAAEPVMHAIDVIVGADAQTIARVVWIGIAAVWVVASLGAKRAVRYQSDRSRAVQASLTIAAYLFLFSPSFHPGLLARNLVPAWPSTHALGLLLLLAGCLLAIWARVALGGNWSANVTVKQGHTLITRGPYALVRHPIYSGLLLAALGTAIVFGRASGFLGFALLFSGFWIKSHTEEAFMQQEFGQQYTRYKQRVRALIPGIL